MASQDGSDGGGQGPAKRQKVETIGEAGGGAGGENVSPLDILKSVMGRLAGGGAAGQERMESQLRAMMQGAGEPSDGYAEDDQDEFVDDTRVVPQGFPSEFVCERDQVVSIAVDGLEGEIAPLFVHQVFPRDKYIIGYSDLRINFHYTRKWRLFVEISHSQVLKNVKSDWDALLDKDLFKLIEDSPVCPLTAQDKCFTRDRETFERWLAEDQGDLAEGFAPVEWQCKSVSSPFTAGKLLKSASLFDSEDGQSLFHRLQAMSVWFIESAEQTEARDWRWSAYCVLQGDVLVGFTSLFTFVNPLRDERPHTRRICQSIVLPPAQKQGLGRAMVETVYREFLAEPTTFEMNVEDPCPAFVKLRDIVELSLCEEQKVNFATASSAPPEYPNGLVPRQDAEQARARAKVTLKQVQRLYDIVRLRHLRQSGSDTKPLRVDIKRRM